MSEANILIIGGGISGLSTAWWLAEGGAQPEVWDAAPRLGGKIRSHSESGYLTEDAAGILMNFHQEVDQLVEASGLSDKKISRGTDMRRYVVHKGELRPVPMKLPALLVSPMWSLRGKLRMATELLVAKGGHERETVSEFIRRRLGSEILEKVMDPFIAGTLASDPDMANAWAVLPRLTALERRYGSFTSGMFINRVLHKKGRANMAEAFSFLGGMTQLTGQMAAHPAINTRRGFKAVDIEPADRGGWCVTGVNSQGIEITRRFEQLVISTPAPTAANLLNPINGELGKLLQGIEYAPLTVLHLGMARDNIAHPLDGTGFLAPRQEQLSFNGNMWMSTLFPNRAPNGKVLLTSYIGGARHPHRCSWNEQQMVDNTLHDLRQLVGVTGEPEYVRSVKHTQALPLYHGHYYERTESIRSQLGKHRGLHLAANYLDGVSARDRIIQGAVTARRLLNSRQSASRKPAAHINPAVAH
ncbi:MAG: protoporphyrinogen oxidase [gamma proteobacterium endosymbiont of Lamellibrachia anaximandri]|nr:protoporphyrinogen oxidase [gamma proteobacterium endosymbiont of Lamellibrachia anaximandri]